MAPGTLSTHFRSQGEPYLAVRWPTHWAASIVASRSGCREAPWDTARYHLPRGLPVSLPRPTGRPKCRMAAAPRANCREQSGNLEEAPVRDLQPAIWDTRRLRYETRVLGQVDGRGCARVIGLRGRIQGGAGRWASGCVRSTATRRRRS
jgi:hypothetical protein